MDSKMEYFFKEVAGRLKQELPAEYRSVDMALSVVDDNNGKSHYGLSMKMPGSCVAPVLNLSVLYDIYNRGVPMEEVVHISVKNFVDVAEGRQEILQNGGRIMKSLCSFEDAKNKLIFVLVNAEKNKALLRECPHRTVADCAVIYKLLIDCEDGNIGTMIIKNKHMSMFGVDENTLYRHAQENTPRLLSYNLRRMDDLIGEMMADVFGEDSDEMEGFLQMTESDMYVLTNHRTIYGASVLLYPGLLKELEKRIGKYYIVPSSTDEVILVPVREGQDVCQIEKGLIDFVNSNYAEEELILSSNLYRPTEDGLFEIAE